MTKSAGARLPATEEGTKRLWDVFLDGMLRIRLEADFDRELTRFGRPCQITWTRSRRRKS